jgi:sigma-54 dependent transcriptional regulator, acetoin dehydrogenase operon transcriptional activator AcoR
MQNFRSASEVLRGDPRAALVLLYAESYPNLEPAYLLTTEKQVIGRDAEADICVPVSAVSRRHAELFAERGRFFVRDLGSTNGVIVDGQRVEEAELETNSELRIGDAIFKFVESGGGDYQRYRIDGTLARKSERMFRGKSPLVGGFEMDLLSSALAQVATTQVSVLILGESGTGKEVAARFLHDQSGRSGDFHAINCAALPENLIESELFGYKRGAFSGADRDKIGIIQAAHRGTLLLDEIGDMPLIAQAKLLRVLQAREVVPVGATKPETVDVRVVAATHRDLSRMQKEGRFRRDLFARLNEFAVSLPPLRDRKEDLFQLVRTFLGRQGRADLGLSFPFMAALLHHDWPYNVRELESAIKRATALAEGPLLTELNLPESVQEAILDYARGPRLRPSDTPSEEELRALLAEAEGNIAEVGRRLGKARMQIHRWLKKYGIEMADYRA